MIIEYLEHVGNESEFLEGDPVWFARYYYPKRTLGIISQSYGKNIVFEGEIFLFDQFGSTAIWNFVAKKSDYSRDQFVYEVFKAVRPRVKELLKEDEKKRTKYPINELYYLRYDLWDSDEAGERRHPCEVVKALGGRELRFEGCPMGDCDYILAQFDEPPVLPKYIEDYSTEKEEKDRIRKEFPEFILEEIDVDDEEE